MNSLLTIEKSLDNCGNPCYNVDTKEREVSQMEVYIAIVYNTVEKYSTEVTVVAANAFCAEQEAMLCLRDMGENPFDWKVIDLEIWD